jgi:uncharacterized membrane protein
VKIFGHPVHAVLVAFPLGMFTTSVIFDVLYLLFRNPDFLAVSFYLIAAAVIFGLPTLLFGYLDYRYIRPATRAKALGAWHGWGNLLVVILFALSGWLRMPSLEILPMTAFYLSLAGAAVLMVTGWLGGELVYGLGEGVDHKILAKK